jgi:tRNA-splicing ligase RtcB
MDLKTLNKINDYLWEIPRTGEMLVPGRIFASEKLVRDMDEKVREQVTNVAMLPGIQIASMAMPDAHWGYGFPIGGVAAFDPDEGGIISMGGVGFDISCGVRTMKTGMTREEVMPRLKQLVDQLFNRVPAGVGSEGLIRLSPAQIDEMLVGGAVWAIKKGFGLKDDLEYIEEHGRMDGAEPDEVSDTAKKRQHREMGTLGSGNHYLEVQVVADIYDEQAAQAMDPHKRRESPCIAVYELGNNRDGCVKNLGRGPPVQLPIKDRELASHRSTRRGNAISRQERGLNCALLTGESSRTWCARFTGHPEGHIKMLYDISHNTCKVETHLINGKKKRLYVHRKGATRAFGPGQIDLPVEYRQVGQPVLIGGTMGTSSYILAGTEEGMKAAFGSACHGAGRSMSRTQAKRRWHGREVVQALEAQGVMVRGHSYSGIAEEAPESYKDVVEVVEAAHYANLARKVARVKPIACVKG